MSSELTIDIQLTELGFSSWDFQLLKQKETPQTHDAAPDLDAPAAPSAEGEDPSVSVGQDDLVACQNSSASNRGSPSKADDQIQTEPTAAPAERKELGLGQMSGEGTEEEDGGDSQIKEDEGNGNMHEEQKGMRKKNGNWEIDVDVYDEEEEEDGDDHEVTEDEDNSVISSDTNSSEEHRCQVCDLTFSTQFLLREHSHVHTGVRPYCCSECGKQFCHLANYRAHLRSHATFSCLICMARFATQELLQGHLDTNHFENEFYQCDFCKRIFVSMNECEEHVQTHQQEVKRYPCSQCDRSFHHQASLRRHLKWHKKSALICTDCGQAFSKKISLLRHSFVHLGLLPYTCVHCKRHFRLASLYHKHQCKPENIQCVACLVVFKSQDDFEKHKKDTGCWGHQMASPVKTNDIRCMECGQIFDSSEELKKHAGTHQRIMKCSECGMGFRSSLMLMSHMGGHAAKRPCLCKECGLGFPHQHAYDSHLKTCGLVTAPEAAIKKTKALSTPKKKEIAPVSPKSKVLPAVALEPQKDVLQGVPLHSVASVGNQTKPSEGQWTLVLNKEHHPGNVPLVMFLPAPIASSSEGSQNPQNLASTSAVPEKHLSVPHIIDVPLSSTGQTAKLDKPVLLQGMASPGANVLIPLTTGVKGPKMRWTILEDQCPSDSFTNKQTVTKENGRVTAHVELQQNINVSQDVMNTMQNTTLTSLSTAEAHNPETPLCLVKVKTEPRGQYRNQEGTRQCGSSSVDAAEERGAALLTMKVDSGVLGGVTTEVSNASETTPDISKIKKEPELWEEHESSRVSPHVLDVVDENLRQCDVCGIVLSEKKFVHHLNEEHSVSSAPVACDRTSTSQSRLSPPPGPPCKRLNLG
ncbi:uncharacterized protein [Salminus brasiliensis]|uniref:uncharacterized protein n=1 Tax=Salminus brasiliensis TaxID=930266 RepID=UPI003B834C84